MPKKQKKKCDVLVIDNASTDGTAELLELKAPTVFYYNTGANLDGAGGFEVGVKLAVEKGMNMCGSWMTIRCLMRAHCMNCSRLMKS